VPGGCELSYLVGPLLAKCFRSSSTFREEHSMSRDVAVLGIQRHIRRRQVVFERHRLFAFLSRRPDVRLLSAIAPVLTFWVMTFQDILRINHKRVVDPDIQRIAYHHKREDAGHDGWFLHDLALVDPGTHDVAWLFGNAHAEVREATFALAAELFRVEGDRLRLVLLLTLESTGHVFFRNMVSFVERSRCKTPLRYFSRSHLAVEEAHSMYDSALDDHDGIDGIRFPVRRFSKPRRWSTGSIRLSI
jgi:hypothetical protein